MTTNRNPGASMAPFNQNIDPYKAPSGRSSPGLDDNFQMSDDNLDTISFASLQTLAMNSQGDIITPPKRPKKNTKDYGALIGNFTETAENLVEEGRHNRLSAKALSQQQMFVFFIAIVQMYKKLFTLCGNDASAVVNIEEAFDIGGESNKLPFVSPIVPLDNVDAQIMSTPTKTKTKLSCRLEYIQQMWNEQTQKDIQVGLDEVNLTKAVTSVAAGAVAYDSHMRQVLHHIGDHYIPIFTLLLLGSVQYLARRVIKRDQNEIINSCSNPISAFLLGSHLTRWQAFDLTSREVSAVTQNMLANEAFGGRMKSYIMWRTLLLHFLDLQVENLALSCQHITPHLSMDEEVGEIIKRQRIEKLVKLRYNLTVVLNPDSVPSWDVETRLRNLLPDPNQPFMQSRHTIFVTKMPENPNTIHTVYRVLREYILLTGRLANEARALREPLLERDKTLIVNGFVAQAKRELAVLRRERMSKTQREEEDEAKERELSKSQRVLEKEQAKKRKERKKEYNMLVKKSKKKKKKRNAPNEQTVTDNEEEEDILDPSLAAPYREEEFDSNHQFFIRELCLDISTQEERDLLDERAFQTRVNNTVYPVYMETWSPHVWKEEKTSREIGESKVDVKKNFIKRMCKEVKMVLKRVLHALQLSMDQKTYEATHEKYKGLGLYVVDKVLTEPAYKKSPLWFAMPPDYWYLKHMRDRLDKEMAIVQGMLGELKDDMKDTKESNFTLYGEIMTYEKYLKVARKEILSIADKQRNKSQTDDAEQKVKKAACLRVERNLTAQRNRLTSLGEKVRLAEIYVASGNFEGIFQVLAPPEGDGEAARPPSGKRGEKKKEDRSNTAAYKLIEEKRSQLSQIQSAIKDLEQKKIKCDTEFKSYLTVCNKTNAYLCDLARERFVSMVDIQSLTLRTLNRLDSVGDMKDSIISLRKLFVSYYQLLFSFHKEIFEPKWKHLKDTIKDETTGLGSIEEGKRRSIRKKPPRKASSVRKHS
ncbi:hypothetical protein EON65_31850, partial [archaeon]